MLWFPFLSRLCVPAHVASIGVALPHRRRPHLLRFVRFAQIADLSQNSGRIGRGVLVEWLQDVSEAFSKLSLMLSFSFFLFRFWIKSNKAGTHTTRASVCVCAFRIIICNDLNCFFWTPESLTLKEKTEESQMWQFRKSILLKRVETVQTSQPVDVKCLAHLR